MQAKIWNYSEWIAETNPQKIREHFENLLRKAGFNILRFTAHHFEPQGYTLCGYSQKATLPYTPFRNMVNRTSSCQAATSNTISVFLEMTKEL